MWLLVYEVKANCGFKLKHKPTLPVQKCAVCNCDAHYAAPNISFSAVKWDCHSHNVK